MSELPKGWASTELANLFEFVLGGDWGEDTTFNGDDYVDVYCIRGTEFKLWNKEKGSSSVPRKIRRSSLEKRALEIGDILIEISGGGPDQPVGRTVLIDERAININKDYPKVCTNFIRLARPFSAVSSSYLNYYLRSFYLSGEVTKYQGGSNNLRNLKFKEYNQIQVPLAPLNEQISIADKLDSILAKVDRAQARLEKIPSILKRFRQSVLAAATSGELTREWREQNEFGVDTWQFSTLGDLSEVKTGSTPLKSNKAFYENGDIPWLTSSVTGKAVVTEAQNFVTQRAVDECRLKVFSSGTLLIAMYGEGKTRGQVTEIKIDATINQACAAIEVNENLVEKDFVKICLSDNYERTRMMAEGGAQPNLNLSKIRSIPIPLPAISEQKKIMVIVRSLMAKLDLVERQYQNAIRKLENLTKAVLAVAFRGELVEQGSNDDPAEALLVSIKKAQEFNALKSKKKQASPIKNALYKKVKVNRKGVMNVADSPDDYLLGLLNQLGGEASAETLWSKSGLNIDQFYAKLKQEVKRGDVRDDNSSLDPTLRKLKSVVGKD